MPIKEQGKSALTPRMMPHNLEAEQSVLGCLMIDDDAAIKVFRDLTSIDFYSNAHRRIFEASYQIFLRREPVDYITLSDELEKHKVMDDVGGINYLTTLSNIVPSAANVGNYIKIVKRYSTLRKLIHTSTEILEKSYNNEDESDVLRFAEKQVFDIGKEQQKSDLTQLSNALPEVIEKFDLIARDPLALRGLNTDFRGLDKITNGLQKGDLIIIAARPSVGKTALALNIVTNVALKRKAKVAVFSLEMPKNQLGQRAICSVGSVSLKNALSGDMTPAEWQNLWAANKSLSEAQIFVDDSSLNTPVEILSKCRRVAREKDGLDLVVIDYIQLISNPAMQKDNRAQQVADVSRNLKIMARDLNVPVIALSQLSRSVESGGKHRRPVLSDLRESGAIEQDADIVMFLHRADEEKRDEIQLLIEKHRNGPLGVVDLKFVEDIVTFVDISGGIQHAPKVEKPAKKTEAKVPKTIVPINQTDIDEVF